MSLPLLMTMEARMETGPACTTPRSSGGAQCELMTCPWATAARANFITSQPAASLNNFSVSSIDITQNIMHAGLEENSE